MTKSPESVGRAVDCVAYGLPGLPLTLKRHESRFVGRLRSLGISASEAYLQREVALTNDVCSRLKGLDAGKDSIPLHTVYLIRL